MDLRNIKGRTFSVFITPDQLWEAKVEFNDAQTGPRYHDHRDFIVDLFKKTHNVLVIDYRQLHIKHDKEHLRWVVVGEVGKAITDRLG